MNRTGELADRPGDERAFRVEPADYRVDFADLRAVRETVFVREQSVPIEEEWDALDPDCVHAIARDTDGSPIGTGRLVPPEAVVHGWTARESGAAAPDSAEARIGRMAVLRDWRGRGVGAALLTALMDEARRRGWPEVGLHAQVSAIDFYAAHGFEPYGERFREAGIEHQSMRRRLEPIAPPERTVRLPPPGEPPLPVESLEQALAAALHVVAGARRELWLYSRDLDAPLYGRAELLDAFKRFAIGTRDALARILLHDPDAAQRAHHPLLALAQRLPSAFEVRIVEEPVDLQYAPSFLVGDRGGVYFRPIGSRYEGEASACQPARARQLVADAFEPAWERARPAVELRALGL